MRHDELARLPDRYRLPMVLCYLEGMACEEVADRLGWRRRALAAAGDVEGALAAAEKIGVAE
jgi:hypothetical protein